MQTYTVTCSVKYWILNFLQVNFLCEFSLKFCQDINNICAYVHVQAHKHLYFYQNKLLLTSLCSNLEFLEGKEKEKEILRHVRFSWSITKVMDLLKFAYLIFSDFLPHLRTVNAAMQNLKSLVPWSSFPRTSLAQRTLLVLVLPVQKSTSAACRVWPQRHSDAQFNES